MKVGNHMTTALSESTISPISQDYKKREVTEGFNDILQVIF